MLGTDPQPTPHLCSLLSLTPLSPMRPRDMDVFNLILQDQRWEVTSLRLHSYRETDRFKYRFLGSVFISSYILVLM